jgi:hypothetical protein
MQSVVSSIIFITMLYQYVLTITILTNLLDDYKLNPLPNDSLPPLLSVKLSGNSGIGNIFCPSTNKLLEVVLLLGAPAAAPAVPPAATTLFDELPAPKVWNAPSPYSV